MQGKRPFTIGVTGGSGSGKTHLLEGIAGRIDRAQLSLISQDHYYKPRDQQPLDENGIKNFDLPGSIDREAFHKDLLRLKAGQDVVKKEYTFNNPSVEPKTLLFKAAPVLIVEGLFVMYFEEIAAELDLKVFVEAKDHLKLGRRIKRDRVDRGYDVDDVLYRYQHHVMPIYESLIEPLKYKCDLIVPNNDNLEGAIGVLSGYIQSLAK